MRKWKLLGKYYGYPECCTAFFIKRVEKILAGNLIGITLSDKQIEVSNGSGFIPCPECAEKVTSESVNTLFKERICKHTFPNDGIEEESTLYLLEQGYLG